jgi:hypothetical protein
MATRTLAQLRTTVYAALDNNTGFYPAAEVTRALNEQVRVANLFAGFIQSSATVTTEANRYVYPVPSPILVPLAVSLDGRPLKRTALAVLAARRRHWARETTANLGAVASWVLLGIRRFIIHPADAVGSRTITVEGISEPALLVNDSDVVQADDEILDGIQDMAAHILQLKEGGKIFADSTAGYQAFLREMKLHERWQNLRHPRFFLEKQQVKEGG